MITPCDDYMSFFPENAFLCENFGCRNHKGLRGRSTGQTVEVKAVGHVVDQDITVYWTDADVTTMTSHQFYSFVLKRRDRLHGRLKIS